jgi:hypothetical protein
VYHTLDEFLSHWAFESADTQKLMDALTDLQMATLLVDQLRPGGHVLFYTKSFAFAAAEPVIGAAAETTNTTAEGRCPRSRSSVTRWPVRRLPSAPATAVTPGTAPTSFSTAMRQWSQVMPVTS